MSEPSRPSEDDGEVAPRKSTVLPTTTNVVVTTGAAASNERLPGGLRGRFRRWGRRWSGGRRMMEERTLSQEESSEEATSEEEDSEGTSSEPNVGFISAGKAKKKTAKKATKKVDKKKPAVVAQPTTAQVQTTNSVAVQPTTAEVQATVGTVAQPTTVNVEMTTAAKPSERCPGGLRGRPGRDGAHGGGFLQPPHRRHLGGPEEWSAHVDSSSSSVAALLAGFVLVVAAALYIYKRTNTKTRSTPSSSIKKAQLEGSAEHLVL